jgi:protein-tyrosine-phosphatase
MANETPPGPGVDIRGNPVIDPTANVIAILEAAVKRQDDLREAEALLNHARDDHLKEMATLRARHSWEIRKAEADRLDSIRAVDQSQIQRAAEVQAAAALTLAKQVADSAETLRKQVADTQQASDAALENALKPIQAAIDDLRKTQYEQQGQKQQVVDTRDVSAGRRQWTGIIIAAALAFGAILVSAAGIIIAEIIKGHS